MSEFAHEHSFLAHPDNNTRNFHKLGTGVSIPLTDIIEAPPGVYLTETRRKRARAAAGAMSGQLMAAIHSDCRQGDPTRPVHPQTAPVSNRSQDTGQAAAVTETSFSRPCQLCQKPGHWKTELLWESKESWVRTADPVGPSFQSNLCY